MIDNIYLFFLNRTIMWRTTAKASYMKPIIELVFDFEKKNKQKNKTKQKQPILLRLLHVIRGHLVALFFGQV